MMKTHLMPLNPGVVTILLRPPPLNLEAVADQLFNSQSAATIHALALKHLSPEHASAVTQSGTTLEAAVTFACLWSENIFPLMLEYTGIDPWTNLPIDEDGDEEHNRFLVDRLLSGIPYRLHGIDYSYELHELHDYAQPALVAGLLLTNSFGTTEATPPYTRNEVTALRNVWAEHLEMTVALPAGALQRIPTFGHQPRRLIQAVTGTAHEMAADLVNYLSEMEDNVFLSWYNAEDAPTFNDPWTDENIQTATTLWERAQTILHRMNAYMEEQNNRIPQMIQEILDLVEATPPTGGDEQ